MAEVLKTRVPATDTIGFGVHVRAGMSRIQKAYEARFRVPLSAVGARRAERGISCLVAKARRLGGSANFARALSQAAAGLEQQAGICACHHVGRHSAHSLSDPLNGSRSPSHSRTRRGLPRSARDPTRRCG